MHIDGQCHCGAVRYRAEIEPDRTFVCHCTDCQTFSGSAFRVRAMIRAEAFEIIEGAPRTYTKVAASGNERVMHFCENCGTHLYGSAGAASPVISLSVITARQKAELVPAAQVWCRSRLPWLAGLDAIAEIDMQTAR